MNKTIQAILLAGAVAIPAAHAQNYVFDWSYSSSLYSGAGTVTIDPGAPANGDDGADAYVPVTFTGTFNSQPILGLDFSPLNAHDNFFYFQSGLGSYVLTSPTQTLWEVEDLAIVTPLDEYVMYGYPAGVPLDNFEVFDVNGGNNGGTGDDGLSGMTGTFIAAPTPEPATGAFLAIGALAVVGGNALRRRTRLGRG